jgi:hypothetical protein
MSIRLSLPPCGGQFFWSAGDGLPRLGQSSPKRRIKPYPAVRVDGFERLRLLNPGHAQPIVAGA